MKSLSDIMKAVTHAYVGSMPCGCGVAIVTDMPSRPKDTAREVADMIRRGYQVQRLPLKEASEVFQIHCENWPHETWQKR